MKDDSSYSAEDKKFMLSLARSAILSSLKSEKLGPSSELPRKYQEIRSCFVTLHARDGSLRGCIGNIEAFEPLGANIIHNALNSAFNDPRFRGMRTAEELSETTIEISVLTPPEPIKSLDKFIIGKHGIIFSKDSRSAVFLPQVAPEQGWDVETTMVHLSMKAGLEPYAWKLPGACFKIFEAIVFSENDSQG